MKFAGMIGYAEDQIETAPGVWDNQIVEYSYRGDVLRDTSKIQPGVGLNDDVTVNNMISVLGDRYAFDHYFKIIYVTWEGVRWKVTSVEIQRPRLKLSLGNVYDGPGPTPVEEEEEEP